MSLELCTTPGSTVDFWIEGLLDPNTGCEGTIAGDSVITFTSYPPALVFIVPIVDTLYAYPNDLGTYRWTTCETPDILGTGNTFIPTESGCYCLETENEFGCTFQYCLVHFLTGTDALPENTIMVNPVPSDGLLQIEIDDALLLPCTWSCIDASGKPVANGIIYENKTNLDLEKLAAGNYFLKFDFGEKGVLVKRIIIE